HSRVRLLELVEEDDGEGLLAYEVDEGRAAARLLGLAEYSRLRLPSLKLAHVEANHPLGRAEEKLCERFRDLGLARPRRPDEEEEVAGRGLVAKILLGELQCLAQSLLRRARDEVRRVNAFVQPLPSVLPYPALRCPAATEFERLFVGERRESAGLHRRAEFRA